MRTLPSTALALAAALVLTACSGQAAPPDADGGPEPEAVETLIPLGAEWSDRRAFTPPGDMEILGLASAGGAIWVIGRDLLRWTTDGLEWSELGHTEAGIPARTNLSAGSARAVPGGAAFMRDASARPGLLVGDDLA